MSVHFTHDGVTFTVDITPTSTGIHRLNAMTHYMHVKQCMISAHYIDDAFKQDPSVLFYHVYTFEKGWVQIPTELGDTLLKHPKMRIIT